MITGRIDGNLEARVRLQIVCGDGTEEVEFIVDTGFNGYLAVSPSIVDRFQWQLGAVQRGITADGRAGFFHTVEVTWHGHTRALHAQVLDEPLVGTRLLDGNEFTADWRVGGEIRIAEMP